MSLTYLADMNPVAGGSSDARLLRHSLFIADEVALPATIGDDGGLKACALRSGCCAAWGSLPVRQSYVCMMKCTHFTINLC